MIKDTRADITEVFSSIQGEGIFLGAKQIFVRFKECNINCIFCDELKKLSPRAYSPSQLMDEVRALEKTKGVHHSVSLTGGEPLLYVGFLKEFLKLLKKEHFKSYLETNGVLPKELAEVIEMIDIVAMDFKLPSSTGEKAYWKEHQEFLNIAMSKKVFVKAVVTPHTTDEDIEKALRLMKGLDEKVPFILQPATPTKPSDKAIDNKRLLGFLDIASRRHLENIRVIPQIHKILKVK
ncbi:MAG: 7-carboxy-7-deazaguanine synthase QueE [Candidatus Omnitrophica bacterium]|nr:7-carboxy-7-deazaguanine synthase QueE [Candidatus Omnitrophota bacterium]